MMRIGWLALLLTLAGLLAAGPLAAQQRGVTIEARPSPAAQLKLGDAYALVIGNNQYRHLPVLQTAVSDAAAVAELLRSRYEFADVTLLLNATRADILGALARYRRQLEPKDRLLIYYAGHGLLDRQAQQGYWLPVEAEEDLNIDWISNATITDALKAMLARHVMIVADSCYSGTLTRSAEATAPAPAGDDRLAWLARVADRRARTALVSGGLEPVTDGGRNGHSVFATAFLDVLRRNDSLLDGQSLFDRLKGQVVVNADQTPAYGNVRNAFHEGGDFIFVPRQALAALPSQPAPPVPARPAPQAGASACMLTWQAIAGSDRRTDLEAFLQAYPDCPIAPIARARLQAIEDEKNRVVAGASPSLLFFKVEDRDETLLALKNANVRSAPHRGGRKLTTLRIGTRVSVTGKVTGLDWLRIALADGTTGYVSAPLLGQPNVGQESDRLNELAKKTYPELFESDPEFARALVAKLPDPKPQSETKKGENTKVAVGTVPAGTQPSGPQPGDSFRDCAECPEMVVLPAGEFLMGSPESEPGRHDDEGPQRLVTIPTPFAVGKYEVTRGEFTAFVSATGHKSDGGCYVWTDGKWKKQSDKDWSDPGYSQTDSDPVTCVNWNDAKAYVAWLWRRTGQRYRLLGEAEWEYAARAGTTTPFHTGSRIAPDQANFNGRYSYNGSARGTYRKKTVPVGSFAGNAFGLHDMHGNVWEWVEDCYHDSYRGAPTDSRAWTTGDCERRVRRGGAWSNYPVTLRSALRDRRIPGYRVSIIGFRVSRTLSR